MAIGGYSMAILVLKAGSRSGWRCRSRSLITMAFGLLVGLPSLRLRADYFAIATIAMAEVVRLFAQNARELTGGNQGLFCRPRATTSTLLRRHLARRLGLDQRLPRRTSGATPRRCSRCLLVVWVTVGLATVGLALHPADALGTGAAGDPGGRGRGAARSARTPCSTSSSRWRSRPRSARSPASSSPSTWRRSTPTTTSRWSPSSPTAC